MHQLDPTDIHILNLLQQDASLELKEIAGQIHKSISPTHQRIKRLHEEGFIQRYTAILDREKIGLPILAIAQIRLSNHTKETLDHFAGQMNLCPEVIACVHVSGGVDFMIQLAVRNTIEYEQFLANKLFIIPHIEKVETFFVLKEHKPHAALPLSV